MSNNKYQKDTQYIEAKELQNSGQTNQKEHIWDIKKVKHFLTQLKSQVQRNSDMTRADI